MCRHWCRAVTESADDLVHRTRAGHQGPFTRSEMLEWRGPRAPAAGGDVALGRYRHREPRAPSAKPARADARRRRWRARRGVGRAEEDRRAGSARARATAAHPGTSRVAPALMGRTTTREKTLRPPPPPHTAEVRASARAPPRPPLGRVDQIGAEGEGGGVGGGGGGEAEQRDGGGGDDVVLAVQLGVAQHDHEQRVAQAASGHGPAESVTALSWSSRHHAASPDAAPAARSVATTAEHGACGRTARTPTRRARAPRSTTAAAARPPTPPTAEGPAAPTARRVAAATWLGPRSTGGVGPPRRHVGVGDGERVGGGDGRVVGRAQRVGRGVRAEKQQAVVSGGGE